MVQHMSMIGVADNSGAKKLMVIQPMGGSGRRFGRLGDVLICTIKEAQPNGQVKEHEVIKAVLVRTRKEFKRVDGSYIKFSDNAAVIIDNPKDKNPIGTRIFGPIAREIRDRGYTKISSMAPEVL